MFTLIIPDLLRAEHEQLPPLDTPYFNRLLQFARTQPETLPRSRLYRRFMCDRLALPPNQVYVSPLCLHAGMNSIDMLDAAAAISLDEARQLCAGLSDLYRADGCTFQAARAGLWILTLPAPPPWQAPPLWDAVGQQHGGIVPAGDGTDWLRMNTEIQMWLHNHALNRQRTMPVNGVWLWNAPPPCADFQAAALLGSNSAWTAYSSLNHCAATPDWAAWRQQCAAHGIDVQHSRVFADDFQTCADSGDIWQYQQLIAQWEQNWFALLWQELHSGSLNGLQIVCRQGLLRLNAKPQRAFWRKKRVFDGKTLK